MQKNKTKTIMLKRKLQEATMTKKKKSKIKTFKHKLLNQNICSNLSGVELEFVRNSTSAKREA